jgi:hypothetical protein
MQQEELEICKLKNGKSKQATRNAQGKQAVKITVILPAKNKQVKSKQAT